MSLFVFYSFCATYCTLSSIFPTPRRMKTDDLPNRQVISVRQRTPVFIRRKQGFFDRLSHGNNVFPWLLLIQSFKKSLREFCQSEERLIAVKRGTALRTEFWELFAGCRSPSALAALGNTPRLRLFVAAVLAELSGILHAAHAGPGSIRCV